MNTFSLDKNYQQYNFEVISVDELQIVSGGSGAQCALGVIGGYYTGGIAGAAAIGGLGFLMGGPLGAGIGAVGGFIGGAMGGAASGAAAYCFS